MYLHAVLPDLLYAAEQVWTSEIVGRVDPWFGQIHAWFLRLLDPWIERTIHESLRSTVCAQHIYRTARGNEDFVVDYSHFV